MSTPNWAKEKTYKSPSIELQNKAFEWWRTLSIVQKLNLIEIHIHSMLFIDLTINDIIEMYNNYKNEM